MASIQQIPLPIVYAKVCFQCGHLKDISHFTRNARSADSYDYNCKTCKAFVHKRHTYGLTQEEYERLLQSQNGVCAICGEIAIIGHGFSVDHDHKTGKVRGLLCSGCNAGLGCFREDVRYLKNAAQYIDKWRD